MSIENERAGESHPTPLTNFFMKRVWNVEEQYVDRLGEDFTLSDAVFKSPDLYLKQTLYGTIAILLFVPEGSLVFINNLSKIAIQEFKRKSDDLFN